MYHVELRHFPFTAYRFNLGDRELLALLDPWVHDKWIDLDERKWSPQQARITVLEGPEMPVYELSMGRGWRSAERKSKDVTEPVLERARALLLQAPGGWRRASGRAGRGRRGRGAAGSSTERRVRAAPLLRPARRQGRWTDRGPRPATAPAQRRARPSVAARR